MGWLGGFLRRSVLGVFCDSAGGVFCGSGRVFGYGKGGFLHPWWFSATDWASGFFASVTGVFCYSGLVRGFFATVGVGGFLRQCWGGFLRQWKGFWLRQGGFFASLVVFCDGLGFGFFASVTFFLLQWVG